jgi:integrase
VPLSSRTIDRLTRLLAVSIRLTPHSFRHTINTLVRNSGHNPAKIRAILGLMDEAIQDNYTH